MSVPIADQIAEVQRELKTRRRVFPRWVSENRLTQADADRRIERMEAVLASLYTLKAASQPGLFDQTAAAGGPA